MNIPALVRRGVKIIEKKAGSVRVDVLHYPLLSEGGYGPEYPNVGIPYKAMMEFVTDSVTLQDGTETSSQSKLTFFQPISVDDRDQFDVPDGKGGMERVNVLSVKGPMDTTKIPYFAEVWLGDRRLR